MSEAFNNVAIHAYRGQTAGAVELELEVGEEGIRIRMLDTGSSFDPTTRPMPDLATLPESSMGLFIMRACMDDVSYRAGNPPHEPNVLTLVKRYSAA